MGNPRDQERRRRLEEKQRRDAERLAALVRDGDADAALDARRRIREGPSPIVRSILEGVLKDRLAQQPATRPSQKLPVARGSRRAASHRKSDIQIPPSRIARPTNGTTTVQGKLRRYRSQWVIATEDGWFYPPVTSVQEGQPGRLVGRTRVWVIKASPRGVRASVDGDGDPFTAVREVPGGAFEQGKNRHH